jgi:hypothetical protein
VGGWFTARWQFSFDHYRDPDNDGFRAMRVFNDDCLARVSLAAASHYATQQRMRRSLAMISTGVGGSRRMGERLTERWESI